MWVISFHKPLKIINIKIIVRDNKIINEMYTICGDIFKLLEKFSVNSVGINIRPINKKSINTITSVTLSAKMDPSTNDLFIFFNKLR